MTNDPNCLACQRGTIGMNPDAYQRVLDWHNAGHPPSPSIGLMHLQRQIEGNDMAASDRKAKTDTANPSSTSIDDKLKKILYDYGEGKYNGELMAGVNKIKQAFAEAGYDKHDWSIAKGSVQIDGVPHLTGAEWLDRFMQLSNKEAATEVLVKPNGDGDYKGFAEDLARRASGLEK